MKQEFISQRGDTDECEILIPLGTKDREVASELGDMMLQNLIWACAYARRTAKVNRNLQKSLGKIQRMMRKCL